MQILEAHVADRDNGRITVEFNGEGGEQITVKLASSSNLDEHEAVEHAKGVMVQVATFGIAEEEFEQARKDLEDASEDDDSPETGVASGIGTAATGT